MKRVLIIGATSEIAQSVARIYAARSARLVLLGRDEEKLSWLAGDLLAKGAVEVRTSIFDANNWVGTTLELDKICSGSTFEIAIVAHGSLPNQELCQVNLEYLVQEFRTNAESVITCLTTLASKFEHQRYGVIAVIGSVAGDRGRESNYLYGAAKAAIETFASGLRVRMSRVGVHVLMIKPGLVQTKMTKNLPFPRVLMAPVDRVAVDITKAIENKCDLIYTPWYWQFVMFIIINIPNYIFKRIRL
jgi:decaprenylphospho-beta-D-erythro-pentofuranosid-2-ulose 2-reductase